MIFDVCGGRGCTECFFASIFSTELVRERWDAYRYVNMNESETRCEGRRVWSRIVLLGLS